jgi:hypothetical protein
MNDSINVFAGRNIVRNVLIDWCLASSEQFSSYIQDENILNNLNATGLETRKGDG